MILLCSGALAPMTFVVQHNSGKTGAAWISQPSGAISEPLKETCDKKAAFLSTYSVQTPCYILIAYLREWRLTPQFTDEDSWGSHPASEPRPATQTRVVCGLLLTQHPASERGHLSNKQVLGLYAKEGGGGGEGEGEGGAEKS